MNKGAMDQVPKSQFITIEGLEGAGKTTQAEVLHKWLIGRGINVMRTREPGGTEIAEAIRSVVLDHYTESMDPTTELLLVFAARKQHLEAKIKPALAQGDWVLSDRFMDATYAYQGGGRQLDRDFIQKMEKDVLNNFGPDLTIWLDCDAHTGLDRASARGALDRIEKEDIKFFDRCREGYMRRFNENPERFIKLDASQSIEEVSEELLRQLGEHFA